VRLGGTTASLRPLASLAALFASSLARAQAEPSDEVTVRGDTAGGFVSRADERTSPRELTDAASLVEPLPGVHVRRYGADDSFTTLSVRGSSSTEVAVYLAGVPLTGGSDPSLDLSTLPLWPGAVARVHRSFAPAAIGAGSLGGTLVLEPPRPGSPETTDVWLAGGSFGQVRLRAGDVRDLGGGARVVTALSASRADDDFSYLDPRYSTPRHDVYTTRTNAGHASIDGLVSWAVPVRWSSGSPGALTVTTLLQDRRQQLPGTVLGPTPFARLDSDRELASAELSGQLGDGAWLARGWGKREGLGLHDTEASAALGPTLADQTIVGAGGAVGWRGRPGEGVRVEATIDGSGERFSPGTVEGAPAPPGAARGAAGGGVDAGWKATPRVELAASGRVDAWSGAASDGTQTGEVRPTGHVGVETALDAVTLAAHAGNTARPPSFVELYGDRGAFLGDPTLRPESAWTVDAGARTSHGRRGMRVTAEATGFATWAQDLITFVPTGADGRAKATNIGQARMAGVELDARGTLGPLELRAAYTGLLAVNGSGCTAATGGCTRPPLPGRPANDFVGDAIVRLGPAVVRAGVDVVTGIVADVAGSIHVPPRALTSVGARVDVVRGVRLALDVRNLLDVRTGTYTGAIGPVHEPIGDYFEYPLPGRSLLLSARFTSEAAQ
jgi:hypothetical protein